MSEYMKNVLTVSHEELIDLIVRAWETKTPLYITGAVGIGKSTCVREAGRILAERLNLELIESKEPNLYPDKFVITDLRLAQRDPADVIGVPYVFALIKMDGKKAIVPINTLSQFISKNERIDILTFVTKWSAPSWLPRDPNSAGILFADELSLAPSLVQSAFYEAINDRRLGDWVCPDKWIVIGAGNRGAIDGVQMFDLADPLANRFCWVELRKPSVESWTKWALQHGVDHRIVSFINSHRSLLHKHDPKRKEKAFPTHRSWAERASPLIKGVKDLKKIQIYVASAVGLDAALRFVSWLEITKQLPQVELYIHKPYDTDIPRDSDLLYSLCSNLADYWISHKDKNRREILRSIIIIADRIDKELGRAEVSMFLLKMVKMLDEKTFKIEGSFIEEFDDLSLKIYKYIKD